MSLILAPLRRAAMSAIRSLAARLMFAHVAVAANGGSSLVLLSNAAHFVAGLDVLRTAVDRDGGDQHRGEHSEKGAVCGFSAGAVGQRFESANDDAGERLHAGDAEHHGGVDRRDATPDQPVRDDAAAVRHHHGAGGAEEADA